MKKLFLPLVALMTAGLQTVSAQGFRVYQSDGTELQLSLKTDSIVFDNGLRSDEVFGPFTPVNFCIAKTWYKNKTETVTFNADGTTDYMEGATYEFMPYQGTIIINNVQGVPISILKVYKVTADKLVVSTTGDSKFRVWTTTPQPQLVEEIVLNETSITLLLDDTKTLTATVLPEDAEIKEVTWESSNEEVAEVTRKGKVNTNAVGTCVITCRATDNSGVYAECVVTVKGDTEGSTDGHEWIDLDLPSGTLWATCNVGANSIEEKGDYFAWAETKPKNNYSWETYKYYDTTYETITKYCVDANSGTIDNKSELEPEDDAATVNWGNNWQTPSKEQFEELIDSTITTTRWMTVSGVEGMVIISNKNGKRIFLPQTGYRYGTSTDSDSSRGEYYSRSLVSAHSWFGVPSKMAYYLRIASGYIKLKPGEGLSVGDLRSTGRIIRPVRKK